MERYKRKPFRALYFQFGQHLTPPLDGRAVFTALERRGLVVRDGPDHYRETEHMRSLDDFEGTIFAILDAETNGGKGNI